MEGKTLIVSVLLLSLVMAQSQIELKSCCPSILARNCYNICGIGGTVPKPVCASTCGCKLVIRTCPDGYDKDILESSGDVINEYCKLGCASSVCSAITTLQNSDASEVVNGAVEQCTKACSAFCTKGSITALETA